MEMLKELLKKKAGKENSMDPKYKDAKMGVLKDIRDMAAGDMGDEIKGLKKVSVMASDRKGLEDGLNKAEDMVKSPELGQEMEDKPGEDNPDVFHEHPGKIDKLDGMLPEDCSIEDIDSLIEKLHAKKADLSKAE